MVSSTKCFAIEMEANNGNLFQIDFSGTQGTVISGKTESFAYPYFTRIKTKNSQNLLAASTSSYFWFYRMDQTDPIYPITGTKKSYLGISTEHSSTFDSETIFDHVFHPSDDSNQLLICGSTSILAIIDTTKLSESTPTLDASSILIAKKSYAQGISNNYIEDSPFRTIDFNHQKPTEFLTLTSSNNPSSKPGFYIEHSTDKFLGKGYIDGNAHGLSFGSVGPVRNIIGTDHFLVIFTGYFSLTATTNKLGLVDTGTISADGKIDYSIVTNKVVPSELIQPYTNFIERVSPANNIWIIGGGSGTKTLDAAKTKAGWFGMFKIEKSKCHEDCLTCINEGVYEATNCITCTDNTKILGPSGCKCSINCLSCSENNNMEKCTSCKKGYFSDDENNDGQGTCVEGKESLSTCTSQKETLQDDKTKLETEKDSLTAEKNSLTAEKDSLTTENNRLTAEKNSLTAEKKTLTDEKTVAQKEFKTCLEEKKTLEDENSTLKGGKEKIIKYVLGK